MNELIFFLHIISVISLTLVAFYIGKSALIAIISLEAVLANLFVVKQMSILELNATCADVFIIGSVIGINLLQEYYGKDEAKKAINISFFCLVFYVLMALIHLLYIPSIYDSTHLMFLGILKFAPRITISSIVVYFIVLKTNRWFYAYLDNKFLGRYLVFRNFISIIVSQFLDTVLFVFMALYGIVGSVWQIIFVSFTLKVIITIFSVPLIGLSKKIFRKNLD